MPPLLRSLTENWKLKLLALALAVLLWVVVSAEQVTSNWIPLPLRVQVTDPNYQLMRESVPAEVEVRFTGPGRELWDLAIRRPPLLLPVDDVHEVEQVFDLEADMVQVPPQLAVNALDVRPTAVPLRFTRMERRNLPVRIRVGQGLGDEWTLVDSLRVEPSRVRVMGPEERVEEIEEIRTLPITLSPGDSAFSRVVALDTSGLRGLRLSATRVRVSGEVDRVRERTYMEVPVSVGPGVNVRPAAVGVRVRGPEQVLDALRPDEFRVVVAIDSIPTRIPPDGVAVPLGLERLPLGVEGALQPGTVRLLPAREPADSATVREPRSLADTARADRVP